MASKRAMLATTTAVGKLIRQNKAKIKCNTLVYVLPKATFPESKVLNIELSEKQISGRTITLKVKYGDVLKADTF